MRIFLTNGCCSIGRRLAGALLARSSIDLFCYDGIGYANQRSLAPSEPLADSLAAFDPDIVVNLTLLARQELGSGADRDAFHDVEKIVDALSTPRAMNRNKKRLLVNVADYAVFGQNVFDDRFHPDMPFAPQERGGVFQATSIFFLEQLGRLSDVSTTTVFVPTLFGEPDCLDRHFETCADSLADGLKLTLEDWSDNRSSYLHVRTVVQALLNLIALHENSRRYVLPGFERTKLEIAKVIAWTLDVLEPNAEIGQRQALIDTSLRRPTLFRHKRSKESLLIPESALSPTAFHDDIRDALIAHLDARRKKRARAIFLPSTALEAGIVRASVDRSPLSLPLVPEQKAIDPDRDEPSSASSASGEPSRSTRKLVKNRRRNRKDPKRKQATKQ